MNYKYIFLIGLLASTLQATAQDTLTLKQAVDLGLQNNYTIRLAKNTQQIATNSNTLGNAGFLPQANLNFNQTNGISNSKAVLASGGIREGKGINTSNQSANALVNWTVFDGFNMFISKNRLEELQRSGEFQARVNIENTVAEIITTYYAIVQQQQMIQVIEEAIQLSIQRLKLAQVLKNIGSASEQAVLQATVDANTDSTNLFLQLGYIQNSKSDLNRLMAREVQTPFEIMPQMQINESIQLTAIQEKLNNQNAQLLLSRSATEVAQLSINGLKSQYLPTVNLFGGYNYGKFQNPISPAPLTQFNGLSYGITATFNIFNGGNTAMNIQNAKIQKKSSELQYEEVKLMINNNLNKIYNDYKTNLRIIAIQKINVEVAKKDVAIALGRFKLGNISDVDLRTTQQKLIAAENTLLSAQFTVKQAEIEMKRMSGEILQGMVF